VAGDGDDTAFGPPCARHGPAAGHECLARLVQVQNPRLRGNQAAQGECRKCAIGQRPSDAALHRLMMHPEFFPDRAERWILPVGEQHLCPLHPARPLAREREMPVNRPISSPLIANSTACRHSAITPILVQPIANEESTNRLPVPLRPVSWNRSSRSSRRRGLAPKSKMLAHISKTELEVICTTVAVAVSCAMFFARFDRGAMSAADRFIGYGRFIGSERSFS
jgi:hypothetical protein